MSDQIPATGLIRVRVLQVNTVTRGETVHDVKARVLPRNEHAKPAQFTIRDELCDGGGIKVGDRLRLTLQLGQVAGVQRMKPGRKQDEADDADD